VAAEHRPYHAHLRHRDVDQIISDRDAVTQLSESLGWAVLQELLEQVHGEAVSRLLFAHTGSEGRVLDQAEYARLLGFLAGLRQSRVAMEAVLTHAARAQSKED
jgi:GTP1/Obg family GTP-binding protein